MFPINFNFPYRKKDGSVITMEKALDGAGADLNLIDLDDVAITTPTTGDALQYNGTSKKWENKPIELDVDDISDVDIATPADGDLLVYDGTSEKWENKQLTGSQVTFTTTTEGITNIYGTGAKIGDVCSVSFYYTGNTNTSTAIGTVSVPPKVNTYVIGVAKLDTDEVLVGPFVIRSDGLVFQQVTNSTISRASFSGTYLA